MPDTPNKAPAKPAPQFGKGQPAHYCGKVGRSGPPRANTNAARHGLKAANLPKGCRYIYHRMCALRRTLEEAVLKEVGEIGLKGAALINTAIRLERNAQLAEHYARHNQGKLPDAILLGFYERAAKASDARDRKIAALPLDRDARDTVIDALYSRPALTHDNGNSDGPA